MSNIPKKYIPLLILIFLSLFVWLKQVFVMEGHYNIYFHRPEHKILLTVIGGMSTIFIFIFGYIGLSSLSVKWVKTLWLYWYVVVFFALLVRSVYKIFLFHYFAINLLDNLSTIYHIIPTPFPYAILWLISWLYNKKSIKSKKGVLVVFGQS